MRSQSVFAGLILILAGIIVFLVNMGYGSWDFVWKLWRYWPILLIFAGIRVIWRGASAKWLDYGFWLVVGIGIILLLLLNPRPFIGPV